MYWAIKKADGQIVVRNYTSVDQIEAAYQDYENVKITLPFEASNLKEAATRAGNCLEAGRFLFMEKQKNGVEIPRSSISK